MPGLTLFGVGMGWVALEAHHDLGVVRLPARADRGRVGMGCIFAPMVTVAMRNIDPRMAGAASGVLNTVRQVGLVIGTAAVGALLQNRLVSSMNSQAATRSAALPPQLRGPFVAGIKHAASNGIQVGAGQNGSRDQAAAPGCPPGCRRAAADRPRRVHVRLREGHAARPCCCPIILLAVGALSCLLLKEAQRPRAGPEVPTPARRASRLSPRTGPPRHRRP